MSPHYYVRLEQGRDRHPSPSVLDAPARVLRIDGPGRAHLGGLVDPEQGADDPGPPGRIVALHDEPLPVPYSDGQILSVSFATGGTEDARVLRTLSGRIGTQDRRPRAPGSPQEVRDASSIIGWPSPVHDVNMTACPLPTA